MTEAFVVLLMILPAAGAQLPHPFEDDSAGLVPPSIESQGPDEGPGFPDEAPNEIDGMVSYVQETAGEILDGVDPPGELERKVGLGGAAWPIRMNSPVPIAPLLDAPSASLPEDDSSEGEASGGLAFQESKNEASPPVPEPAAGTSEPPAPLPSPTPNLIQPHVQPAAARSAIAPESEPWPLVVALAFSLLGLVWWLHHFGAGLSRIRAARILDNPQRQILYEYICLNPGLGQQDIATAMGKNRSTINHHFQMLERAGYATTVRDGRRTLYFDGKKALSDRQCLSIAVLRNSVTKAIAQHVQIHPGITQDSLARAFDVSASTVIWHTRRLNDAGILHSKREGRYRRFFAYT